MQSDSNGNGINLYLLKTDERVNTMTMEIKGSRGCQSPPRRRYYQCRSRDCRARARVRGASGKRGCNNSNVRGGGLDDVDNKASLEGVRGLNRPVLRSWETATAVTSEPSVAISTSPMTTAEAATSLPLA